MNRPSSEERPQAAAAQPATAAGDARAPLDAAARRRRDRAIVLLLGACVAIGPLAMDIYLPSLPAMAAALQTTPALAQATIATYMAGYAIAQLIHGPASDRWGRRPVLLVGVAVFAAASFLCAAVPSIDPLLWGRAVQAVGVAAGMVLARTIIRDLYEREQAARLLALTAVMLGVAPIVAPLIGAALQVAFGWRSTFLFLGAYGMLLLALLLRYLPETRAAHAGPSPALREAMRQLASNRAYRVNVACSCGVMIGLFAFLAASPVVLMQIGGLSVLQFGIAFAAIMAGNVTGALLSARYVMRWGLERTRIVGAWLVFAAGVATLLSGWIRPHDGVLVVVPFFAYMIGFSLTMPQVTAAALTPFARLAGLASSVMGLLQFSVAAAAAAIVSALGDGTVRPMATMIFAGAAIVMAAAWVARPVREPDR
ncbi:MAG TPA: multidrug effflux MFS transporter [Burkholderiaceae bacterium]|nr:multidrug effflux MFS transporter [Burkholderiaceae bacterium]